MFYIAFYMYIVITIDFYCLDCSRRARYSLLLAKLQGLSEMAP